MSGGEKRSLTQMARLAAEFIKLIDGTCERIEIAGSIRRQKTVVGDIELVVIPEFAAGRAGLFVEQVNQLRRRLEQMAEAKVIQPRLNKHGKRFAWLPAQPLDPDPRYVALLWRNTPVDLFMVLPDRLDYFGYIYWLRTGPRDANQHMVTVESIGGMKPANLQLEDGQVYRRGKPLPVPTEQDMFTALELAWVRPQVRSISAYLHARKVFKRARLAEMVRERGLGGW
jgi:DNA polymerase/3'-5' exonuclease PolX